ncbi:3-dehydroquinate synthase [bacterium]|nr:3-dehydroquinate synthase [bacterium]
MNKIDIEIPKQKEYSYPVIISENLIEKAEEYIKHCTKAKKFLVVTNETIYPLFKERFKLSGSKFLVLPDGEEYKSLEYANKIIDSAIEDKLDRTDAIIALGGGVIGDMAGFGAAVYQRGIDYIQIPTTLLAQVDSSVGGKVAVNHREGKNLIGNFYQPKLVLSDISALDTLDLRQFKTGLAEVLKYAFIENSCRENGSFFKFLKDNREKIFAKDRNSIEELISTCCRLKSIVVNHDEKEKGLRAILNFGHTFAHAIEKTTNYTKYTHGEAVSIGMVWAFEFALSLNIIDKDYCEECINLIKDYGLMTKPDENIDENALFEAMTIDKKVQQGKIRFVIPKNNFKVEVISNIEGNDVLDFLKNIKNSY